MTSPALLTDRYELTMIDAALHAGTAHRPCVFELFARRLPDGRRFGVVGGTGRLIEAISEFRFGPDELAWLKRENVVAADTLDWLESYRFSGTIRGYREGELYFPGSPLLVIEAGFAEGVVLETLALSTLNYDSAVASAAARMVAAAGGRPLAEMGSRRTGERSAVSAARAAYIAGFNATSNLEAGRRWGVPTMGTSAHAFTLLFPTEEEAFAAQVASLGPGTTLLVDTYDIRTGVENAVRAAGTGLGAVRIDSGDLGVVVREVRKQLDELGATGTKITVTNDLDEHAIASLAAAPVDSYGVGTSVVTGSGHPAAGMVYKLVARQNDDSTWSSVGKTSEGKATIGGRKQPIRALWEGVAVSEDIYVDDAPVDIAPEQGRALHTPLVTDGEIHADVIGIAGVQAAREHNARAVAEMPNDAFRLSRGEPAIRTRYL
ncbi:MULTISPECIES: nicotinate phosphoribosyltransferase [unclassified Salinibacterium]|uniref:nicotinate phosphoribosyltransferase n=1 Tax=unclassified Salinibacterium TaxID=2632331 RepID=UPI00141DD2E4|nr:MULTISPECIES: nicotinate phosphoribosyltransferase [unclassified Salinibacterium]